VELASDETDPWSDTHSSRSLGTKESIFEKTSLPKISPIPSLPKRGFLPFVKGGKEGFSLRDPYNCGLISKAFKCSGKTGLCMERKEGNL